MPDRDHCKHSMGRGRGLRLHLIDPIILLTLYKQPTHGYSLIEELARYGMPQLDISILYRALHQMEEMGWVTSTQQEANSQGPPRRVYQITSLGESVLANIISDLEKRTAHMEKIIAEYRSGAHSYQRTK
ncbi:MAG: hypothetical protein GYA18_02485 [Chloroflexi bacterium]|nr:hypothetical protein [Chloroflexota bacterium]